MAQKAGDIIREVRKRALREVMLKSNTKHFKITKNYKTGKIVFKPKEPDVKTLHNTNYLQYDTRTV